MADEELETYWKVISRSDEKTTPTEKIHFAEAVERIIQALEAHALYAGHVSGDPSLNFHKTKDAEGREVWAVSARQFTRSLNEPGGLKPTLEEALEECFAGMQKIIELAVQAQQKSISEDKEKQTALQKVIDTKEVKVAQLSNILKNMGSFLQMPELVVHPENKEGSDVE